MKRDEGKGENCLLDAAMIEKHNIYSCNLTCMNPHHGCSHRAGNPSQPVYLEQSLMVGLQRRADPNIAGTIHIFLSEFVLNQESPLFQHACTVA